MPEREAVAPTFDTPLSYQARCGACERFVGMGHSYYGHCGVKIDWSGEAVEDDSPRRLLTGGDR
jgi:hypothetical protein